MPKLGKKAKWEEKKEQIKEMWSRQFFLEDSVLSKAIPHFWEKDQVEKFYEEHVTNEMVDKYLKIVENERKAEEQAKIDEEERIAREAQRKAEAEAFEKQYQENRPTAEKDGLEAIKTRLQGLGLPKDEYEKIVTAHEEDLEIRQLENDGAFSKLDYKKDYNRLINLKEKNNSVKVTIGKQMDEIAEDKKRLNFYQDEIAKYDKPPRKPGRLAQMWNNFQKAFTGSDIGSVQAYNHYTNAKEKVAELEEKIIEADESLRKQRQGDKKLDDYLVKRSKTPRELAEHIVRSSIAREAKRNPNEPVQELSKEEFSKQVDEVMDTRIFKELMSDLRVDQLGVKPELFDKAFMKRTAQIQMEEKQKTESAPEKQKEKVKETNKNKEKEGPQLPSM